MKLREESLSKMGMGFPIKPFSVLSTLSMKASGR